MQRATMVRATGVRPMVVVAARISWQRKVEVWWWGMPVGGTGDDG